MIPLDFVAGTHGHFLEYVTNRALNYVSTVFDPFTKLGTSHQRPIEYLTQRKIICGHWFENDPGVVGSAPKTIRIVFDQDDILLVSSLSLLRAADLNINNNDLHIDTVMKLNNDFYSQTLDQIYQAYQTLDRMQNSIPRNVLREFFKFGFSDPDINGYWKKLQDMCNIPANDVFDIDLKSIYDYHKLENILLQLASWLDAPCNTHGWLQELHVKFMSKIPFMHHKDQCDQIIQNVIAGEDKTIPDLSMLQESYINGRLEKYYKKEMPFHQLIYFTNTKDVLKYIESEAPDL